mgnify:CR=1 FL=1
MSDLEMYIKESISNYVGAGMPIEVVIVDIAREFNISYSQAEYEVEKLLGTQTDGGMTFQDEYAKKRWTIE